VLLGVLYFAGLAADAVANPAGVFWQPRAGRLAHHDGASPTPLPQLLYRRTFRPLAAAAGPLFRALAWLARPCVALLGFFQSLVELTDDTGADEEPTPAENIEALISAGTEEGLIEEEDRKLIQSVVEFGDKVVREVMTPRPNIVAIRPTPRSKNCANW
jgi:CBS domain containing-hemolysin-like protein